MPDGPAWPGESSDYSKRKCGLNQNFRVNPPAALIPGIG